MLPLLLALAASACTFDGTGLGGDAGGSEGATTAATSTTEELTGATTTAVTESAGTTDATATTSMTTTATEPTTTTTTDPLVCGDGVLDPGEACDNGEQNADDASCKSDCTLNLCGDGAQGPGEGCDDGNAVDGDGCSAACVLETCGDTIVDPGEACDDGNDVDDDECTNACSLPACGDMIVQESKSEACDDGPGNGPSKACTPECAVNVCGDGFPLDGAEACDDGNDVDSDACTNACEAAACGDGIIQVGVEECDDGNADDMDACSNLCMLQGTRVFVTEATFDGDLGGLAGAHAKCQAAADTAGLGGTWKAWIASGILGEAPADVLAPQASPYVRIDGMVVADGWADLIDGSLALKIDITENGVAAGGTSDVWTNVAVDGTAADLLNTCLDWTSKAGGQQARAGLRGSTDAKWTDNGAKGCNGAKHLYCFEV